MLRLHLLYAAAIFVSSLFAACCIQEAHAWVPHIVTKGNRFFDSASGLEFRMKGVAYYPRPNAGKLYEVDNYDWVTDDHEAVWKPHLDILQELGVNTIRLYSVDPSKSHDKFMCECSKRGIYVLVGMSAPCKNCAISDALPPACYPDELFTRAQMVYNAFAIYDNTLGFSVGNENNLQKLSGKHDGTTTAPCVKAFLRDVRRYASSCVGSLRAVPIGLDIADIPPRAQWLQYYDCCVENDEHSRAEWIGFNPYVECDPKAHTKYAQSEGLRGLMKEYQQAEYPRPLMFGEFGCNLGDNTIDGFQAQRAFYDAKWMNEEKEMTDQIVGGNVFEFTTERIHLKDQKLTKKRDDGKYGIGYFSPDDCDHGKTPCKFVPYPEFANLKTAYTTTTPSTLTMSTYNGTHRKILKCPKQMSIELQPTPTVTLLKCSVAQPVCSGTKANAFKKNPADVIKMGDKKKPSNRGDSNTATDAAKQQNTASNGVRMARSTTGMLSSILLAVAALWLMLL
uniref:1,3-beta-glucanosyltransferase n=1 Tax=Globisporangium ultimum (strain ATCC 200006 / CBS 805.95 / DAOM BR144) TaxID=431595 RepID=K3WW63_GLOUD